MNWPAIGNNSVINVNCICVECNNMLFVRCKNHDPKVTNPFEHIGIFMLLMRSEFVADHFK
jgi:hypothetical protein